MFQTDSLISILRRFDKPGPRYTSYPTAPVFSTAYGPAEYEADIRSTNVDASAPLSLYLHIPFCDTLCYFCGCTTVITRNRDHISRYLETLKKEIAQTAALIDRRRPVVQMAWGGGTPSSLTPAEIRDLASFIRERFQFAPDAEFSVELDPRELTEEHMRAFVESGANRFSLGVQDFDDRVQAAVHRIQPEDLTTNVFTWSRALGVSSMNVDLIYGLPLQSVESFQRTLDRVVALSPDRVAVFNFAYVPWMKPHQKLIHQEDLPSPETKLELLMATITTLHAAGYEYIGMDHFAKPHDELAREQKAKALHRNFQGYSTRAGADLYGFGMSAISHIDGIYAQNVKTLDEYHAAVSAGRLPTVLGYRMTEDDRIRKYVIMRLMCDLELDTHAVEQRFGIRFDEYFADSLSQLSEFTAMGLVRVTSGKITVEADGRFVLRNIAMCFDAFLKKLSGPKPVFSRTV